MENKIFQVSNIKKTLRYLKKNGVVHAYYAARERIGEERKEHYCYVEPSEETLAAQRREAAGYSGLFSIIVPAYETKEEFLREMIASVRKQSYGKWELIIVDAGSGDSVEHIVGEIRKETGDGRIKYRRLRENKGIAENTNAGIEVAEGDYIALLDHDDFLTPDALYYMARAVREEEKKGVNPALIYSDEDKFDNSRRNYISPHRKMGFNLDLILSNNYVCHFTAVRADLMKTLGLRGKYDGAQDYDLVLRVVGMLREMFPVQELSKHVIHIPEILYHWRCHEESTAANTASKMYAYEAGKAALQDFCVRCGWRAEVEHSLHLGFYRIKYQSDVLTVRDDVGIVGGRLLNSRRKICGGAYQEDGSCMYEGLHKAYSGGSTHRAVLKQDLFAVDIRCMRVRSELQDAFEEVTGFPYRERVITQRKKGGCKVEDRIADISPLNCDEAGYRKLSMEFGRIAAENGYLVLWDPDITITI